MIPLLTAFDVQQTGAVYGFALVSAVVWCLDMNISFFRGFINARTGPDGTKRWETRCPRPGVLDPSGNTEEEFAHHMWYCNSFGLVVWSDY